MKTRFVLPILLSAGLAIGVFLGAPTAPSQAGDPIPTGGIAPVPVSPQVIESYMFDRVWQIMNRPPTQKGCVGCHVGPQPRIGFWFGPDKRSVLRTLETGINPRGQDLGHSPIEGGRNSILADFLHNGIMPLGGQQWEDADLDILDAWLRFYE